MRKSYKHFNYGDEIYDAANGRVLIVISRTRDVYQCEVHEYVDEEGNLEYTGDQLFTFNELALMETYQ